MTSMTHENIEFNGNNKARLVANGQWLYDNLILKPVQIFAINYDYYFEMDNADGCLEQGQKPELNEQGEQYLIAWHNDDFFSFAASTEYGGFTIDEAKATAEAVVEQKINWVETQAKLLNKKINCP